MPGLQPEIFVAPFSEETKRVIKIAQAIARDNLNASFGPAHLLKALLHSDAGLQPLLKNLDKDIYYIEEWAEVRMESFKKAPVVSDLISADTLAEEVMNEADNVRLKFSKEFVEPVHVLAAVATPGVGFTFEQLKTLPLRREELLDSVANVEEIQSAFPGKAAAAGTKSEKPKSAAQHALLKYCIDKSLLARQQKLDAIIGRDKEIRMIAEILGRRSKPNVLIVGEPGVGKSSLVDAFAMAIVEQKVPQHLLTAQLFELDNGALIAGASYKGEIEDRLKNILAEIKQFDKAILFIDEIHTLIDKNGSASGAVNMLKPELARGEITLIGATTKDEYRKYIEQDEALNRRFEQLVVEEPDPMVCFHMVKAVISRFEKHHHISVPEETIRETIRLAKRYIKDRRLPDAAIDLADRSMASLKIINDTAESALKQFREQVEAEKTAGTYTLEDWQWMSVQMKNKLGPILWSYFESEADPLTMTEAESVKNYVSLALDSLDKAVLTKHTVLQKGDVAAIVSYKTGIPIGKVQTQEKERLLGMEEVMKKRVIGQDHAIKSISEAILESRSGLGKPGQPIGSFFFLGPTGTGKTELAKTLASFLFQDESFMIRFDMSEFKEEHSAALLYGAPPGYVGYQEGGLLVNKIREKPYSVVLFDEIEKAHPSVFDIFLQIMDEGKLHDKLGKEGDFSNAVIIFTSNVGSQFVVDSFQQGEVPSSNKLMEIMGQKFRPEFLGRLTEIIPFAPMNEKMVENILHIQLKSLFAGLEKQSIRLSISEKAIQTLSQLGFTPRYGARPLNGVIRSQLRRPLSRKIISGEIQPGDSIGLDVSDNKEFIWNTGKNTL